MFCSPYFSLTYKLFPMPVKLLLKNPVITWTLKVRVNIPSPSCGQMCHKVLGARGLSWAELGGGACPTMPS